VDYLTGFSKVNNQDRYKRDISELELRFRKRYNPTVEEIQKRIKIVAQGALDDKAFYHYLPRFIDQIEELKSKGVYIIVAKPPLPKRFYDALPNEQIFDSRIKEVLAQKQVPFYDFSLAIPDYKYYFDTDHLNRTGVQLFFNNYLKEVLLKHNT
jgi:hypothetical protein